MFHQSFKVNFIGQIFITVEDSNFFVCQKFCFAAIITMKMNWSRGCLRLFSQTKTELKRFLKNLRLFVHFIKHHLLVCVEQFCVLLSRTLTSYFK